MHKDFYASGFIFHPRSNQILLQQANNSNGNSEWTMFGCNAEKNETVEDAFARALQKTLKLNLRQKSVFSVYQYFHSNTKKEHFVSYLKVNKLEKFPATKKAVFSWFSFKEVQKLNLSEQTKQDIVVGQRVIDSDLRKRKGLRTIG